MQKKACQFKLEALDTLEQKKADIKIALLNEDDPYARIKMNNRLAGIQDAIEIIQELASTEVDVKYVHMSKSPSNSSK
jgi:glutaredoxin